MKQYLTATTRCDSIVFNMSNILKEETAKVKLEIRNRYIAGETVEAIGKRFKIVRRTVYYHLGKITSKEKGLHAQNASMRKSINDSPSNSVSNSETTSSKEVINPVKIIEQDEQPTIEPTPVQKARKEVNMDDFLQG